MPTCEDGGRAQFRRECMEDFRMECMGPAGLKFMERTFMYEDSVAAAEQNVGDDDG